MQQQPGDDELAVPATERPGEVVPHRPKLPVVLIPGLNCTPALFGPQLPALAAGRLVMVGDHTRHDRIAAIAAAILEEAPPRFALAGLSMGGYVCFEMLRQQPERIARLALLDSSARADTPEHAERRRAQMALASREGGFDEVCEMLWSLLVHEDRRGDLALRETVMGMAKETGAETFIREQTALLGRPDSRADLAAIPCPTTVIVGDADRLTPPKVAREIADGVPGARLVEIPHCGHLSTLERPEAVTTALMDWLAE